MSDLMEAIDRAMTIQADVVVPAWVAAVAVDGLRRASAPHGMPIMKETALRWMMQSIYNGQMGDEDGEAIADLLRLLRDPEVDDDGTER